jgi:hypothetical protein
MFASSHLTPEGRYGLALDQIEAGLDVLCEADPTELDPSVLGGFVLKMITQSRRMGAPNQSWATGSHLLVCGPMRGREPRTRG